MARLSDQERAARILQQHRELLELLARIERVLGERSASVADAARLLGQLGDQLVKHFTLEEGDGYFSEALTQAPQLVARANDLLAQHPKMTAMARELAGAEPGPEWWTETRRRYQAFVAELRAHERLEDQLLQQAYTQDLSAHD